MELTPQALHDVEFREARRGGYNTRDVDDFLERVAVGIGQLQDRLREAYHRAEAAEGRLAEMQRQIDDLQRRGPSPMEPPVVPAPAPAPVGGGGQGDADETLRRTLVLAQRTADATIKEAKDEATRVLDDAREEAARTRAAAGSEAMRDAKAEVDRLEEARDGLLHDIDVLEHHVDEQRSRVRVGVEELQRLLDDPEALRTTAAPSITDLGRRTAPRDASGAERPSFEAPPFDPPSYDPPSFEAPAAAYEAPSFEAPSYEAPSFDPPSFEPPSHDLPARDVPSHDDLPSREPVPAASDPANNGGYVPKGGQVTIPAPEPEPEADPAVPSANGHSSDDMGPAANNPLNDGAMVAALQELHGTAPGREPLPPRSDPPHESLPSRDALPSHDALPAREALPSRDPAPVHEAFEVPSARPEPLTSRGDLGLGAPAHEPFETLPPREPLPARNDAAPGLEPFETLLPRETLPSRGDPGPAHQPFEMPPREPLQSRGDAGPSLDPLPAREPLPARNSADGAGGLEPLNFPPPTPGATGFLPDLNAAFNPPPPPADDLGVSPTIPAPAPPHDDRSPLSMDSPPPPPPPPGFEHLNRDVGGIPIEPGSRPSEWGRGVFDTEDEMDGNGANGRFGRR